MNIYITTIQYEESENVTGGSQESTGKRGKPQIIQNCKKDINLAFLPNQIEESFVSLQLRNIFEGKIKDYI